MCAKPFKVGTMQQNKRDLAWVESRLL